MATEAFVFLTHQPGQDLDPDQGKTAEMSRPPPTYGNHLCPTLKTELDPLGKPCRRTQQARRGMAEQPRTFADTQTHVENRETRAQQGKWLENTPQELQGCPGLSFDLSKNVPRSEGTRKQIVPCPLPRPN